MKRYIYGLLIALGLLVPLYASVVSPKTVDAFALFHSICSGNNDTSTNAGNTDFCKEARVSGNKNPIVHAITIAIDVLSFVIGFAAVVVIILSGFKMITSRGDPQGVAGARTAIIYAVIGLAISVAAVTIVSVVLNNI